MSKLTEKQKAFADYYIESLNAKDSAIKAGYSENTAGEMGYENLNKPHIKDYIDKRLNEAKTNRIASITDIMEFWSNVMNNEYEKLGYSKPLYVKDRQVASDSLMKRLELAEGSDKNKGMTIKIVKASEKHGE